jgi:ketose-bisphosphate aldolase
MPLAEGVGRNEMPLVSLQTLFAQAIRDRYAIGYFEAWDSYSLEAVVEAAEAEFSPVILGFGCMMVSPAWLEAGGIETLGYLGRMTAEQSRIPVSLILNEARTFEQARRAIESGFNTVMLDTSAWSWQEAVTAVRKLVEVAHPRGVAVEGEVGRLPDAIENHVNDRRAALTDPDQAAEFVEATGIDCLAVAIGNVHLLTTAWAPVNLAHLEKIHQRVSIPLVMHGGSSFPPEAVQSAIASGVCKFNVGTILKKTFLGGVRQMLNAVAENTNVHDVLGSHQEVDFMSAGKVRMRAKVRELMQQYGSSGRIDYAAGA